MTGADGRRALALATRVAEAIDGRRRRPWQPDRSAVDMFPDITSFIAELDRRKELARIAEPVSPDLEIAAVIDRVSKSPGGGPALLFERPTGAHDAGRRESVRLDVAHLSRARRGARSTIWRARSRS